MKMKSPRMLAAGFLALTLAAIAAATPSRLNGHWQIDLEKSTPIRPWDQAQLEIKADGDSAQIVRHLRWGLERKVDDTTNVKTDGQTVTANPIGYWLDTWYTNVYIGGDHQKQVTGEWLDGGRVLKLESRLALEAQQGDHPVHIYDEYRLSPDGNTLTQYELRSTRDQAMTYVFHRINKFEEPAGMVTTASGLRYAITRQGTGPLAKPGQILMVHYTGTLADGTQFDSSRARKEPYSFELGRRQVIKGWDEGFALLHVGDQAVLIIPPKLAYGRSARGPIPANSTLKFEVELLDAK